MAATANQPWRLPFQILSDTVRTVELKIHFTQQDLLDAYWRMRRSRPLGLWLVYGIAVSPVVMGLLLLVAQPAQWLLGVITIAVGCALPWALPLEIRWRIRRQLHAAQSVLEQGVTCQIAPEGISFRDASSETTVRWDRFVRMEETKRNFLLVQSDKLWRSIPKAGLTPSQADELRDLLSKYIQTRAPAAKAPAI